MVTEMTDNKYATHATGTAGISLGTVGTVLGAVGLLGSGAGMIGNWGRRNDCDGREHRNYITKEEFDLNSKIMDRDTRIAVLESGRYVDQKLVEVYKDLNGKINSLTDRLTEENKELVERDDRNFERLTSAIHCTNAKIDTDIVATNAKFDAKCDAINGKIECNKDAQQAINCQQGVYNATTASTIGCMQRSIDQLYGITTLKVQNSSLCPGVPPVYVTHTAPVLSA